MAIGKSKSKLGNMLGANMKNAIPQPGDIPLEQPEQTPAPQPKEKSAAKSADKEVIIVNAGGRPKFELIAGMPEKKVNFHCPEDLFWAINKEATEQHKTNKQLICEMLLEVMTTKYGFKLK